MGNKDIKPSEELKIPEKDIKPSEEVKIPEVEIHGVWGRIAYKIRKIPRLVWIGGIIIFLALVLPFMPQYIWIALWTSLKAQKIIVGLVLVFGFVAVSLVWAIGQRIDVWVFMYFNMRGKRAGWLDSLMLATTQLGNFIFALAVALILILIGDNLLAYELLLGISTLGLVVQIMKTLIHRTRPYIKLENIRIIGSRASGQSFPSGHTGQAFLMATLMLQYYHVNIFVYLLLYIIALLVGITRIYVGMHYPRDVIGGAILGTAWGLLGVIVNNYMPFLR